MESKVENIINNACPSILYRIKSEIIKEKILTWEKIEHHQKIIKSPIVIKVLEWQNDSGYFSERFHTPVSNSKIWSHEGCVRYLLEKGLDTSFQPLKKALDALLLDDWKKECTGKTADLIGVDCIRASLFAQAGYESHVFIKKEINNALAAFRFIYESKSIYDIIIPYKDKQIFVEGKYLPNIYHLRTLAYTESWKSNENIELISYALNKLYNWLPIKPTYIKYKSQLIAPAGNIDLEYNKDLLKIDPKFTFWWITFYELIARMGMLTEKSLYRQHIDYLIYNITSNNKLFIERCDKKSFFNWSGYSGMSLEDNWKDNQNKINDLMFRIYLIKSLMK